MAPLRPVTMAAMNHSELTPAILLVAALMVITPWASASGTALEDRLSSTLAPVNAGFQGYEQATVAENGYPKTYLLLDFEGDNLSRREQRQERIHHICSRILTNRDLVEDLSRRGVHMVSIAFDRQYQYDCL